LLVTHTKHKSTIKSLFTFQPIQFPSWRFFNHVVNFLSQLVIQPDGGSNNSSLNSFFLFVQIDEFLCDNFNLRLTAFSGKDFKRKLKDNLFIFPSNTFFNMLSFLSPLIIGLFISEVNS